ncbi:MAG: RrF2 family transcriptional regulator [Actinomycetota bacterium]
MRISLKTDYALRAMVQLAAEPPGRPIKAEHLVRMQGIPLKFLLSILSELKLAHLLSSQRGPEGGYMLRRPPSDITLADVIRAVDGPLANVHDHSLEELTYVGAAEALKDVWMAVRASLRSVLEAVTLADLASGSLPEAVRARTDEYRAWAALARRTRGAEGRTRRGPSPQPGGPGRAAPSK